jgi:flagellar motor switch/type III secretory pathway protein FliN
MSDETKLPGSIDDAATVAVDGAADDGVTQAMEPGAARHESASPAGGPLLERLEMPVEVRFGELRWTLARLLDLRVGDAVPVGPDGHDTVRLFVQGRPFALGELVVVHGRFGFRVTELLRGGDA